MQHACYMQFLTEYMQIVTCLLLWLTICMFHVTCRDLGRFFHMLHAGFMQVSCRLQSCQHVLMVACFMTVTCRRDAWSLHVTSMLPVHNMQVSCMQHAEFIQITSMEHAEFIQITCMQHAEFIQITCMQHAEFIQITCMQHAEFIQITCMQHAEFIQITCMQHDDFLHVLYMLKFYKKKTVLHSTSYRYKVHNIQVSQSLFLRTSFLGKERDKCHK